MLDCSHHSPIVGLISTADLLADGVGDRLTPSPNSLFSFFIVSLNNHGAKWPRGSIETIFFLSAHWGKGPTFSAGSVLVKSGLWFCQCNVPQVWIWTLVLQWLGKMEDILPMIYLDFVAGDSQRIVNRVRTTMSLCTPSVQQSSTSKIHLTSNSYEEVSHFRRLKKLVKHIPFRRRMESVFLETTTGPLFWKSWFPQSIGSGLIPDWPGYVLHQQ